jgi:hypothetical protein
MSRTQNPNLALLERTVTQLGEIADDMAFVGGCVTGLLLTDPAAPPIRATKDVDAIVQVISIIEYHGLANRLRQKGFSEDTRESAPICRWITKDVILDVMPTEQNVFGFGNRWYKDAAQQAQDFTLSTGKVIHIITAPFFLVTKFDAFDGRGKSDYVASHDMEDIIAVLDGRPELLGEINRADVTLKGALAQRFKALLLNSRFIDAIPGHLGPTSTSPARFPIILDLIRKIAELT